MTTKLTSPSYSQEISSRVTLINCCVRESCLQEQFLYVVIANENADKHKEKTQLVKQTSDKQDEDSHASKDFT